MKSKKKRNVLIILIVPTILVCSALWIAAAEQQYKELKKAEITTADPLKTTMDTYGITDSADKESVSDDTEEIKSTVINGYLTEENNRIVAKAADFQATVHTYILSADKTGKETDTDRKCISIIDIEFPEKIRITGDCYLNVEFDDQVSPMGLKGNLYYRDDPNDEWSFWKETDAQSLFSLTRFTFLGSEMKKDNRKHYIRMIAVTEDADFYPSGKSYVSFTVTYLENMPLQ